MSITPLTLAQLLRAPSFMATEVLSAALAPALAEARAQPGTPLIATVLARSASASRARLAANEPVPLPRAGDPLAATAAPRARVVAEMPDVDMPDTAVRADYRVEIAGKPFTLPLRGSYRDGEQVRIILQSAARPAAEAANSARAAADLARLAQPAHAAETLVLSADAQRLGSLLNRIEAATARSVLALPESTLQEPPTAGRLAQAVSQSGLFYESHLAEWVRGRRSLEQLRDERQAFEARGASPGAAAPSDDAAAAGRARSGEPGLPNSLLPVIKEQLNTIDSNRFTLHGLVWANQPAELTIAREYANSSSRSERQDIQAAWATNLKLRLPALGRVEAAMLLTDRHLRLCIATEARSDERLRAALTDLADALEARGLALQPVRWEVLDAPA
ncbi:MAG TPA: flagellar hook-length control protein FliK [Burkholderiales bacterium]|nr:flagellar hook-length control protein FliK [Burkholderiales bacterium]